MGLGQDSLFHFLLILKLHNCAFGSTCAIAAGRCVGGKIFSRRLKLPSLTRRNSSEQIKIDSKNHRML